MLVAIDDMVGRKMLPPDCRSFVVTAQPLCLRPFKNGGIQTLRIQPQHIYKEFPCPIYCLLLEIVAK